VTSCRNGAARRLAQAEEWGNAQHTTSIASSSMAMARSSGHDGDAHESLRCRSTQVKLLQNNGSERQPNCRDSHQVPFFWSAGLSLPRRPVRSQLASALGLIPAEPQIDEHARNPRHAPLPPACHWTHDTLLGGEVPGPRL
jgi:hypothetical protein